MFKPSRYIMRKDRSKIAIDHLPRLCRRSSITSRTLPPPPNVSQLGLIKISDNPSKYCRHPLVFLVEAADDICYQLMDLEDAHKLMKQTTGWLLGDLFEGTFQKMQYFYTQSAVHLQYLLDLAPNSHPAVARVAEDLLRYIQSPGGIVSNTDYGVLGYADDASLIHTLTLAMKAEGFTDSGLDATDWDKIDAGAETAFSLLGADVKTKLQKEIENYYNGLIQDFWPERIQQIQLAEIQKQRDDLWKAKLIGAQGDVNYLAGPYYP